MKIPITIGLIILIITCYFLPGDFTTTAIDSTKTIYFSNLNESGASSAKPGITTDKYHSSIGMIFTNLLYVKVNDLCSYLGVSYYTSTGGGNTILTIHGNSSPKTAWSSVGTFSVSQNYSVATNVAVETNNGHRRTDGTILSYSNYSYSKAGDIDRTYILYNNFYYVPARATILSLGSLLFYEDSAAATVFDYRVNNTGSFTDDNLYLTGGSWLTNWSAQGTSYVAPHFLINELWSKNTDDTPYLYQLKMSVKQLSAAELVRKFYRNDSSLGIDPGFRGWHQNYDTDNAALLSWHTRGRAWDSDGIPTTVQDAVLVDFGVKDNWVYEPYNDSIVAVVRSRKVNYGEISFGDEMETGVNWLHIQTDPLSTQTVHTLLP